MTSKTEITKEEFLKRMDRSVQYAQCQPEWMKGRTENRREARENGTILNFKYVPFSGTIVAAFQFPNPKDSHLWLVLVCFYGDQFGVWTCNAQSLDYSNAEYFTVNTADKNRVGAYQAFMKRASNLMMGFPE